MSISRCNFRISGCSGLYRAEALRYSAISACRRASGVRAVSLSVPAEDGRLGLTNWSCASSERIWSWSVFISPSFRRISASVRSASCKLIGNEFGCNAGVAALEVRQIRFDFPNFVGPPIHLLRKKRRRLGHTFLPGLNVFAQIHSNQIVYNLLGPIRMSGLIGNFESDSRVYAGAAAPIRKSGVNWRHADIVSHPVDDLMLLLVFAVFLVKIIFLNEWQQDGTRHHLLSDDFDTLIREASNSGTYQVAGNLLLLHHDGCRGSVKRRPADHYTSEYRTNHCGNGEDLKLVPPEDGDVFAQVLAGIIFPSVCILRILCKQLRHRVPSLTGFAASGSKWHRRALRGVYRCQRLRVIQRRPLERLQMLGPFITRRLRWLSPTVCISDHAPEWACE